jgi:hypothetical protein
LLCVVFRVFLVVLVVQKRFFKHSCSAKSIVVQNSVCWRQASCSKHERLTDMKNKQLLLYCRLAQSLTTASLQAGPSKGFFLLCLVVVGRPCVTTKFSICVLTCFFGLLSAALPVRLLTVCCCWIMVVG